MAANPLIFMLLMFGVFYFILIRPQVKRQKAHQTMLQALQRGDMVITRGGLIGKISGVTAAVVTLELQEKIRVRVVRSHIEGIYDPAKFELAADSDAAQKAA